MQSEHTEQNMREKESIKIHGDSISTHWEFQKKGYPVYYDEWTAEKNGLMSYRDCWWWPVSVQLAMKNITIAKIENYSYSGSFVTGSEFPSGASDQRIREMKNPYFDCAFILIYMGFNDFGRRVPVWPEPGKEDFYSAYVKMLQKMKEQFPRAQILPATLLMTESDIHPRWRFPDEDRFYEFNKAIRTASLICDCTLVDLAATGVRLPAIDRDHTHPDVTGHCLLAQCWIDQLKKKHVL